MRVFLYEYATAQPASTPLPDSVRTEGRAMFEAVRSDLEQVQGIQVETLNEPSEDGFRTRAAAADWSLIIAPEFDGLLLERCRWVVEAGGRLLGPPLGVIEATADKWRTHELLCRGGVPTPPTCLASTPDRAGLPPPWVVKPRYGAGSMGLRLLSRQTDLSAVPRDDGLLIQSFVPGLAASIAFLCGPSGDLALPPGRQVLANDGTFAYLGGRLPLPPPLAQRAEQLGRRAIRLLPNSLGYVGIDLVLGENTDASQDRIIEINPRLTTSYIGLRRLACGNLAEAMLRMGDRAGGRAPIRWRPGDIWFLPDGSARQPGGDGLEDSRRS